MSIEHKQLIIKSLIQMEENFKENITKLKNIIEANEVNIQNNSDQIVVYGIPADSNNDYGKILFLFQLLDIDHFNEIISTKRLNHFNINTTPPILVTFLGTALKRNEILKKARNFCCI